MGDRIPYLNENERLIFPAVDTATDEGIIAVGGNLSPGLLLSAYEQGIFPWYSAGEPVVWWSPDPRFVLYPGNVHISASMRKCLKRRVMNISLDGDFRGVITACAARPRPGQSGTWITDDMLSAYVRLHELGYAHSVEVYKDGELCGGLYGISLGAFFFGESMFSTFPNASKTALVYLCRLLDSLRFRLIDCQVYTPHLERMGAIKMPRSEFIRELGEGLIRKTLRGSWSGLVQHFAVEDEVF